MTFLPAVLLAAGILIGQSAAAQETADCMGCHGEGLMGAPEFELKAFESSVHGANGCVSCHSDASDLPHPEKLKAVRCAECHEGPAAAYARSAHGRAVGRHVDEAATCGDCHGGAHGIVRHEDPGAPSNRKNIPATCGACHADKEKMAGFRLSVSAPFESYEHSVHGRLHENGDGKAAVCTDCHGAHQLLDSSDSRSRVHRSRIPRTCGRCHKDIAAEFVLSAHGKAALAGIKEAPVCTDCHGEHTIRPVKSTGSYVSRGALTATCAACHASERLARKFDLPLDRFKSYADTYHGLAAGRGDLKVANCASCHGFHGIRPADDPESMIHPSNIAKTCGACHEGAGARLAGGSVHGRPDEHHWTVKMVRSFYLLLIPLVIGGMLFHNTLDFLRKAVSPPASYHVHGGMRFSAGERIQHAVNGLCFMILAYTGFLLKYPESWWAVPVEWIGENARRDIHRGAAIVFCLLGAYHLGYMAFTKRGRRQFLDLLPKPKDAWEPLSLLAYNAGIRTGPPRLSAPYNYIEKSEYWALLWGSFVMAASGAVLAFPDLALRHLPMWVPDLATAFHFYEAVLACLAILVWHMYWVIFDPAVYPMSWVWLTGFVRRSKPKI